MLAESEALVAKLPRAAQARLPVGLALWDSSRRDRRRRRQRRGVATPHGDAERSARFLTFDEAHVLVGTPPLWTRANRSLCELLIRTALDTGLRLGELLALAWRHVDLSAATLRVERSLDPRHSARTGGPSTSLPRRDTASAQCRCPATRRRPATTAADRRATRVHGASRAGQPLQQSDAQWWEQEWWRRFILDGWIVDGAFGRSWKQNVRMLRRTSEPSLPVGERMRYVARAWKMADQRQLKRAATADVAVPVVGGIWQGRQSVGGHTSGHTRPLQRAKTD
jgi:integrase